MGSQLGRACSNRKTDVTQCVHTFKGRSSKSMYLGKNKKTMNKVGDEEISPGGGCQGMGACSRRVSIS